MFVAFTKEKKRVHISKAEKNEEYYCPICEELLIVRHGTINTPHFAHKSNSLCSEKDGWHYDMSAWHYDWQNQFPLKNQEIIFKNNNKIHRADVFINNTVIEFQHSPISESEFYERNDFYKNLKYKIIWIFDVEDKEIKCSLNSYNNIITYRWKNPIRFLAKMRNKDPNLTIYLQTKEAIWYRQPNYKDINDFNELQIDSNIIKMCDNKGIDSFFSDNYYSDIEIIDNFCNLEYQNKKKYPYKLGPNFNKLTDEVYNHDVKEEYKFYGYCPLIKNEFFDHTNCHACNYLNIKCMRCMYRFRNIKKDNITNIYDIKYDRDGRVIQVDIEINNERKKYKLIELPNYTKTLLEFALKLNNITNARFINTKTNVIIQMSSNNLEKLIRTRLCYGRICKNNKKASKEFYKIYRWNEPIWLLIWFV